MTHDPLRDVDRRLRDAFEPDSVAIARVVAGAASGDSPRWRRRRRPLRLAWAGLAGLAVAIAATAYWRSGAAVQPEPAQVLLLFGSFTDDVFVVSAPDGSISLSGPGSREDRPPDGSGNVLVEGDLR